MLARSGLGGTKILLALFGAIPGHFFPWADFFHDQKMYIFLGGPMGPIHLVWALAAIHPRWGN